MILFVMPQVFTHDYVAIILRMIGIKSRNTTFCFGIHVYERSIGTRKVFGMHVRKYVIRIITLIYEYVFNFAVGESTWIHFDIPNKVNVTRKKKVTNMVKDLHV